MTKKTRRSRSVTLSLLAAAAAIVIAGAAGCSDDGSTVARCVDANGNVLPDSACQSTPSGSGGGGGGSSTYYQTNSRPRWVYGGDGGTSVGSHATGYSETPPDNGNISTPSGTVVRGGFGGEGDAGGHGGGEAGGHGGGGGGE